MTVTSRVRTIYERHPYPPPSSREKSSSWALGALPWIGAVSENFPATPPRRVLIAGCGVGTEAFAFARQLPDAQVVGVDFSPRSIDTARRTARRSDVRDRVTFNVADLTSATLPEVAGMKFDLIVCHGVLSYIANTTAVFRNFVRCLSGDGIVVLGVNGAEHPSSRWRPELPRFGIDQGEFKDGQRMRQVLRVFDSLSRFPATELADLPAGYLAGDIFGPLNRALRLEEWIELSRDGGLHFLSTYNSYFAVRSAINRDLHAVLMPRSRGEVARLVDKMAAASFLQIVLSRRRHKPIPWNDARALLRLRPTLTSLYAIHWPRRHGSSHDLQSVALESLTTRTKVTLDVPRWEVELLRASDGERPLRQLVDVRPPVPIKALREAMYLLYQLAVLNLR